MVLRRFVISLLTVLALTVGLADPSAAAGGVNNYVSADNANPAKAKQRSSVKVVTDADGTVDAENVAAARSHDCTGCRTLAVAMEVVLVPSPPSTVAPVNVAWAVNERCSSCATFASAHQYVVQTGGPKRLSDKATRKIAALEDEVARVIRSDSDFPTIDARLDEIASQIWTVVNNDVVKQGGTPSGTPTKN